MQTQRTPFWELLCGLEERSLREQDASSADATSRNSADEATPTRGAMFGSYVEELAHRLDEVALAGLCRADMAARVAQLHGRQTSYALALNCSGTAFLHRKRQADGDAEEDQHDQYCVQLLEGLNRLGCLVDGSKAVKTSDPLFRSFVRFQFNKLKSMGKIHQHASLKGDGVMPTAFVAVRQEILMDRLPETSGLRRLPPPLDQQQLTVCVVSLCPANAPELVYGQTCCLVSPDAKLGLFSVSYDPHTPAAASCPANDSDDDQLWVVCTAEAMVHLQYQGWQMAETGVWIGAPGAWTEHFLACRAAAANGKQFGISADMILPDISVGEDKEMGPLLGRHLAEQMTEEELTQHRLPARLAYWQYRRAHIELAIEPWKGRLLSEVYGALRQKVLSSPQCFTYYATESECLDYGGEKLIVATRRRYFIDFTGEWKQEVSDLLDQMESQKRISEYASGKLKHTLRDIRDWSFAQRRMHGTALPWDNSIDPYSEQSLVHVFLTVAHELTGKVAVDDVTDEDWERIFALGPSDGPPPAASRVPHAVLAAARQAFQHWLLAFSVGVHSLLHHVALFGRRMCPQAIDLAPMAHRPFVRRDIVELASHSASVVRLVMAMGQSADMEHHGGLARLYHLNETLRGLCAGEQAMRSDSIKQVMHRRALVLFAHFHSPESPFAMLPLELVGHIVGSITTMGCPGFDDHYLMHVDRLMRSGTSECLIDIAHALAQNDFREVVRITLDVMPHVLDRYRRALGKQGTDALNRTLIRRFYKIQMCALWPICPVYCAYAWTTHLKATSTMPDYWRKFVRDVDDGCEDEAEDDGVSRIRSKLRIDVEIDEKVAEQSSYLMSLIERLKALKKRKRGVPSNELVAQVTVCRGQPEWATPIVALMEEHLRGARPSDQQPALSSYTKQVALKLLLEQAPYMRHKSAEFVPLLEHLWRMTVERRSEQAGAGAGALAFDEARLLERMAPFVASSAGLAGLRLTPSVDGSTATTVASPAARLLPGLPAIEWLLAFATTG
ncbi:uncharacterized protein ACA1_037170 [Acanthamoeba castellanii str. Neff]|uniref:Uncharacterized protein n=1 Tax=Acanthamoeba castellanii (strain ATCC 30010 / Neff) TaxID=1257118 RepID=L8H294_ACACF|nr:uncharacterized protein ACA1_037170 [Acanthamoeba castellanii str. Neff]ELR18883.1 hypothetical protein ACA1_037170 [Acanthamoeba castellanii str. Neff]